MAGGYCTGQTAQRTFPSLQKVVVDNTDGSLREPRRQTQSHTVTLGKSQTSSGLRRPGNLRTSLPRASGSHGHQQQLSQILPKWSRGVSLGRQQGRLSSAWGPTPALCPAQGLPAQPPSGLRAPSGEEGALLPAISLSLSHTHTCSHVPWKSPSLGVLTLPMR